MEQSLTSGIPAALSIWLILLGISAAAFAVLAAVARRSRANRPNRARTTGQVATGPRSAVTRRALAAAKTTRAPTEPRPRKNPTTDDGQRFAEEIVTAANRAGVTAERRHEAWLCAQRAMEAAWDAYECADRAARRAIRASAFPIPATPLTPAEYANRERHLHQAARAAHARGELSTDQLIDAMSHRNGFDPRTHPFEQDAMLRRIARDRLLRVYLTASDLERAAWRDADLATAAKRSLDREARHAVQNLRHLRHHPSATDRSRPWTRWTGSARPRLALR